MPKVIIWRDGAIETEFDPGHRDWRMGRSETNDITLLDPRKSVSRFHAELREENGRWVFIDLNSQNGSWKEGQRVNRLVLEHGHEVLFGDYKLSFEDARVAAPPPLAPSEAEVTADVHVATAEVPIPPDQTLLMPGKVQASSGSTPAVAPPPVVRAAVKAKPPRKGVNPVILVLFLVAMLGAVAAVAWKVLSGSPVEPRVVESSEPAPPPAAPEPAPVAVPAPVPAAVPATPDPSAPVPPPAPGAPVATTKRTAPAAPKDNPTVVARYEEGRRALGANRFAEAERAFQAVLSQQPGFRDAAGLLQRARDGQAAARAQALTDAQALEASGDWARAIAAYERAGAGDQASGARAKMTAAGDDAYRKARQFDARNRPTEAIGWYQKALDWLPDSDARKAAAQERLAALKGGGE